MYIYIYIHIYLSVYARTTVFAAGPRTVPIGGLLHFSPVRTCSKEHQAHASRALVVLSLLNLVCVHRGFACCVRGTLSTVISAHRLMAGVPRSHDVHPYPRSLNVSTDDLFYGDNDFGKRGDSRFL